MGREHLLDAGLVGLRVEDQVDLGLGVGVVGEGVVEEVIEDLPIEARRLVERVFQRGAARLARPEAGAGRQPAPFDGRGRQAMGLHVVENLEAVFDHPQEGVGAFEDRPLLIGEAACFRQPSQRLERVAGADPRRGAAVEQLQKLDREFHVADAASAVLHVAAVATTAAGPLFDLSLERFDAADIGRRKPAAIDPGLEFGEYAVAECFVAGNAPGLHPGLSLPGAARLVVELQHLVGRHHHGPGGAAAGGRPDRLRRAAWFRRAAAAFPAPPARKTRAPSRASGRPRGRRPNRQTPDRCRWNS